LRVLAAAMPPQGSRRLSAPVLPAAAAASDAPARRTSTRLAALAEPTSVPAAAPRPPSGAQVRPPARTLRATHTRTTLLHARGARARALLRGPQQRN
jgi:hypothetical protein